ncbi:MAG: hypothetical protein WBO09_16070 [Methylocystis silviterrae]|uniref:hypothetical protein n=1 Tax=Methylocystis silviterrae TaxID=2743612 RepID=UPI003C710ED1
MAAALHNDARDAARPNVTLREDVGPRHAALSTPENRVIGGVQLLDRERDVMVSKAIAADGPTVFRHAEKLEGIVSKRIDKPYPSGQDEARAIDQVGASGVKQLGRNNAFASSINFCSLSRYSSSRTVAGTLSQGEGVAVIKMSVFASSGGISM